MDDQILCLYAKGMSTRDIVDAFAEMYGAEVSPGLISKVTSAVMDEVVEDIQLPHTAKSTRSYFIYPIPKRLGDKIS